MTRAIRLSCVALLFLALGAASALAKPTIAVLGLEVIDKSGTLAREWRGVKVPGHAQEVLDFVKTL